jgi:DNA-binding response OmpR family regulator
MADVKKVLVVDDHFEMLELLRSMLELSNDECEVMAVPSAEEGMLELRRIKFDLVITDVRLPGMSGFDFVRRIRKVREETPVLMITGYSSSEGQKEADELGVLRYFSKPLDTDAVLMAVQVALHGEPSPPSDGVMEIAEQTAVSNDVVKRLTTLRTDTGASGLMLSTLSGQVVFQVASDQFLDLLSLSEALANTIHNSFSLAGYLEADVPNTIQYHAGDRVELYCANIGLGYFLTIFFDVQSRRGRIGTIWVFTQRAIKDLIEMLPDGEFSVRKPVAASEPSRTAVVPAEPIAPVSIPEPEPEPEIEVEVEEETAVSEDFLDIDVSDLDDLFGDAAFGEGVLAASDFWDDAMTEHDAPESRGLSLEEARKQGLIPTDLDLNDLPE